MGKFKLLPTPIKIKTVADALAALDAIGYPKWLAFDFETTGKSVIRDRPVILSLYDGKNGYVVWPDLIPYFSKLFQNPMVNLIGWNIKYDTWMYYHAGCDVLEKTHRMKYRLYDAMVAHIIWCDCIAHDLKSAASQLLGVKMKTFQETFGLKGRNKGRPLRDIYLDPEEEDIMSMYAMLDAYSTYELFFLLQGWLKEQECEEKVGIGYETMWDYFEESEVPFTTILWKMEVEGIHADEARLLQEAPILEQKMLNVSKWFAKKTGQMDFNPGSDHAMRKLLFEDLDYRVIKTTDTGQPSVDAETLKKYAQRGCEYCARKLEYSDADKKLGTYILNLLKSTSADGKVHTTFKQGGARTGRLASADPNMQNQPEFVRDTFLAPDGWLLYAPDYSQLEIRVLAHITQEPTLVNAINLGRDPHSATAAQMFGEDYDDVVAAKEKDDRGEDLNDHEKYLIKKRKAGKTLAFAILYGQGPRAMAATLGISVDEAKENLVAYFKALPEVANWFEEVIAQTKEDGYCTTLMGRRRYIWNLYSMYAGDISEGERQSKNSVIQGSASDICKMAMINIWESDYIWNTGARMLLQVHDEIVFKVPEAYATDKVFNDEVTKLMAEPFVKNLIVPLGVSAKYGKNWAQAK
jgi:DNA polymerase I